MLRLAFSWRIYFVCPFSSMMNTPPPPLLDDTKDLSKLTKQALVARVLQLQDYIQQKNGENSQLSKSSLKRKQAPIRPFSFENCGKRRIALKFAYIGSDYDGFAQQVTTEKTIEHHVLQALKRTRL